ncbi:Zinc finger C2HC domain-containing protein 1A [Triplophysa tibetana]|uniref:Zinc finger C2HC domain-containing protein 1A n=1 Tax=Triplophysa tibetana TaxID=1572043 RepID=A0A5A9N683_9TELE|nr:Zinc finger C2HC domain-containing protein 1A [Triplophysa tibetana]
MGHNKNLFSLIEELDWREYLDIRYVSIVFNVIFAFNQPEPTKKQSNWRRKHEEFVATIRAAKGLTQVMKTGGPLPPPPPPSYDPDYIQCPYCQRRFGENAADRHIKFCKEQASRISNKSKFPGSDKAKPPAKTLPKPPPPKKANSLATPAVSSRLPQLSAYGQAAGTDIPSIKTSSTGLARSVSSGYSPLRNTSSGLTSPPSETIMKPKGLVSQSSVKYPPSGIGMNKKKVQNADNCISRNDVKNENDINHSTTRTKFCHECGTKYPVDWAKFCCECGGYMASAHALRLDRAERIMHRKEGPSRFPHDDYK